MATPIHTAVDQAAMLLRSGDQLDATCGRPETRAVPCQQSPVAPRVITFDLVTDIAAPIETVFDLARDLSLHERSMAHTGERAVAGRTSGLAEAGDSVTWRARHFGVWWQLTSRITVVDRPHLFVDVQAEGPFAWFRHVHRFESIGGMTRMRDHWEHASPLGPLGSLVDRLVLGRYLRRELRRRNAVIKTEAEAVA